MLRKKGFTLIEVVIVLAIGALIILVVLQAVSAARRSQRDDARRAHASQMAGALEQYAANNAGAYPAAANWAAFMTQYLPNIPAYTINATCTPSASVRTVNYTPGTGTFTLQVCLESAGANVTIQN